MTYSSVFFSFTLSSSLCLFYWLRVSNIWHLLIFNYLLKALDDVELKKENQIRIRMENKYACEKKLAHSALNELDNTENSGRWMLKKQK